MSEDLRTAVLLSLQRALWEQVPPDLRGVSVRWMGRTGAAHVVGRFHFEGEAGDVASECVSETETYFLADFDWDTMTTDFVTVANSDRICSPTSLGPFCAGNRWTPLTDPAIALDRHLADAERLSRYSSPSRVR